MKNAVKKTLGVFLALVMVLGLFMSQTATAVYADDGTWIYVDGQNGSDSNDGKTAGTAVKSWDQAKKLLGCAKGGIYVVGTVDAEGIISTKMPSMQSVKRESDIIMFNVSGEATFVNIDVDGEDKKFDSEIIHPSQNATVNFLSNAVFHNIGYLTDKNHNTYDGGIVLRLAKGVKIKIDGATFRDNQGKGIIFTSFDDMISPVTLEMVSGEVTGNEGFFYYNESDNITQNYLYIYNALITENDATSDYRGDAAAVWLCNQGKGVLRSVEGLAIFDNVKYDLMNIGDRNQFETQGETPDVNSSIHMLGGGDYNWEHSQLGEGFDANTVSISRPTDEAKAAAVAAAKSKFTNNNSQVIHSNGTVQFGHYKEAGEKLPTPTVPVEQGCDDTPTTPTTTPKVVDTTAKINDKAEEIELNEGEEGTMTDVVKFEGLEDGKKYEVVSTLFKDGEKFDEAKAEVTSKDSSKTITFTKKITEEGKYTIKTELMLDGKVVDTHNADLDVASETVKVTVKKPEKPQEPDEPQQPEKPQQPEEPKEEPKDEEDGELPPPNVPSTGRTEPPANGTPKTDTPTNQTPPPQIPSTGKAPATGDTDNAVVWIILGVFAAFVATLTLRYKVKR